MNTVPFLMRHASPPSRVFLSLERWEIQTGDHCLTLQIVLYLTVAYKMSCLATMPYKCCLMLQICGLYACSPRNIGLKRAISQIQVSGCWFKKKNSWLVFSHGCVMVMFWLKGSSTILVVCNISFTTYIEYAIQCQRNTIPPINPLPSRNHDTSALLTLPTGYIQWYALQLQKKLPFSLHVACRILWLVLELLDAPVYLR